jgi:hypothetical protein
MRARYRLLANLATRKRNIAVDMWTTQERCPHAHSDNNRRKQLIKMDHTNNHPLDCAMSLYN